MYVLLYISLYSHAMCIHLRSSFRARMHAWHESTTPQIAVGKEPAAAPVKQKPKEKALAGA